MIELELRFVDVRLRAALAAVWQLAASHRSNIRPGCNVLCQLLHVHYALQVDWRFFHHFWLVFDTFCICFAEIFMVSPTQHINEIVKLQILTHSNCFTRNCHGDFAR